MSGLVVRCGAKVVFERTDVESRWTGDIEDSRMKFLNVSSRIMSAVLGTVYAFRFTDSVYAAVGGGDKIRHGFMQIIDVFTALAEPILWFYALTACILMATGRNKDLGWDRLKRVGYAYIFIALLPTFFTMLRWVAGMLTDAVGSSF